MKKTNTYKFLTAGVLAAFLLLVVSLFLFYKGNILFSKKSSKLITPPSLDEPNNYPADSAIPYYTLKWMNNIKFTKLGILSRADIQTTNEGRVTHKSIDKPGEINIDKVANVNYPFVARIELTNPEKNTAEILYFSKIRFDKAQIFRIDKNGNSEKANWSDIKIGDYAIIEENINLLISNVDKKNNFTDEYLKSLTIYLK